MYQILQNIYHMYQTFTKYISYVSDFAQVRYTLTWCLPFDSDNISSDLFYDWKSCLLCFIHITAFLGQQCLVIHNHHDDTEQPALITNQVTLKSYLNMKTASIAHFNFRAKWHQHDHCGEVSVKPKSWVPHRFPTIHTCSGNNQVTIQGVNMLWIWSFKKVTQK